MIAVKSPGWNSSKAELARRKMRFAESMTESLRLALWQSGPGHQGFGQQSCRMPPIPKPQLNSALHSPRTRSPATCPFDVPNKRPGEKKTLEARERLAAGTEITAVLEVGEIELELELS
ncbi:hypothetical protein SRHO_G00208460 [Serrasalmus rhombeus]